MASIDDELPELYAKIREDALKMTPEMAAIAGKCRESGDWLGCIYAHPRPLRAAVFEGLADRMPDQDYWNVLREVWQDVESPGFYSRAFWLSCFLSSRPCREQIMSAEEHTALGALPDPVTLYRGAALKFRRGLSWTTDQNRAVWFAHRFSDDGWIHTVTLPKRKLLAYFLERTESEAVIDPRRVMLASRPPNPTEVEEVAHVAAEQAQMGG